MARLIRVDSELVRRGLVRSRTEAQELILAGQVTIDGVTVTKPARQLNPAQAVEVKRDPVADTYVSRGAHKLAGALQALGELAPQVNGRRCLDAGASTGGFTDVLLRRGAKSVVAVDVGYGQLAWSLQTDPRVEVHDRTNIRNLSPAEIAPAPDLCVGDLSFISLTLVIPALVAACSPKADFLLLVKPQFEVGKERLGKGGVVRDPKLHCATVIQVAEFARQYGLDTRAAVASPLPGPAGNVEYFLLLGAQAPDALGPEALAAAVNRAVEQRPTATGRGDTK